MKKFSLLLFLSSVLISCGGGGGGGGASGSNVSGGSSSNPVVVTTEARPDKAKAEVNDPVTISPLSNDQAASGKAISITSVGTSSAGTPVLNGDNSVTFTPNNNFVGEANFDYTVTDNEGSTFTGKVYIAFQNNFTWTGAGADNNWSNTQNWCGSIVGGECQGDGSAPGASDIAYFNSSCTNCDVTIDANVSVDGIRLAEGYSGIITQNSGRTIIVGDLDWIQDGGTFVGGDSTIQINRGTFELGGGSFTSTTGDFVLWEAKGGYATHDYLTISKTNTFHHNNGRVWFHLYSSNHPIHLIKVTGSNPFNNVLVKRSGGQTDDVRLSTVSSPDRVLVEGNLNLENISILGQWEVQGNIYYGPQYGTYQGTQDAEIFFTGSKNQTIEVDAATGFSKGDVTINKTGGTVTLNSALSLNTAGQDLTVSSGTTINMSGNNLTVNQNLNLNSSTVINRGGGTLSYGAWNSQGTIN